VVGIMNLRKFMMLSAVAFLVMVSFYPMKTIELKARANSPIYGLSSNAKNLPMVTEASRDPELLRHTPESEHDATNLMEEIKEYQSDLKRVKGWRKADLHEQSYRSYVSLSYYLEDVISGRIKNDISISEARNNLSAVRRGIIKHANKVVRYTKDKNSRVTALFHVHVTSYNSHIGMSRAVKSLVALKSKGLNGYLKRRVDFLSALHKIKFGSQSNRGKGAKEMARLLSSLPRDAGISGRLALARYYAGLNRNAHKSSTTNKTYRSYLWSASTKVNGLSKSQKAKVLSFSTGVWTKAEGSKINWTKPPFKMANFNQSQNVKAIIERAALADWKANRRTSALRKYAILSNSLETNGKKAAIDLRILDLNKKQYLKTKNSSKYERALVSAQKNYLDPGLLGEGKESKVSAMLSEIRRQYRVLAYGELSRVSRKGATRAARRRAIRMGKSYMASIEDAAKIEDVKSKIAAIYHMDKQYENAVAMYRSLGETNVSGKTAHYYKLAIAAQSQLAHWPTKVSWEPQRKGYTGHREQLVVLYKLLGESDSRNNWYVLAQNGLLNINLDQRSEAFQMWEDALKKSSSGSHAAHAAGYMLSSYEKSKNWNNLETLSRLCRTQKVAAVYRGKRLDTYRLMALALLEGGKQAVADAQYAMAVKKLEEFTKRFKSASNQDEGMFVLATAYRGNSQHPKSISTLVSFSKIHSKSRFLRQALLNGGDWSTSMAYEENTMYFFKKFVKRFNSDSETTRVRGELIALYEGRRIYGRAVALLSDINTTESLTRALEMEDQHGSKKSAQKIADKIISKSGAGEAAKAEAYAVKARYATSKDNFNELKRIERKIYALGAATYESQEALGEIRFVLAEAKSKTLLTEYYNLALKDPTAELNKNYSTFLKVRTAYHTVCDAGQSSYCAPAMNNLARVSQKFAQHIEDLQIQATLAKSVVDEFDSRKQAILNEAVRTSQRSDSKAVATVIEGNTNPDWTQAVLWQNTSDWNFDRITGETGNGYVQWTASQLGE
jgi:hypothetical protein